MFGGHCPPSVWQIGCKGYEEGAKGLLAMHSVVGTPRFMTHTDSASGAGRADATDMEEKKKEPLLPRVPWGRRRLAGEGDMAEGARRVQREEEEVTRSDPG